MVTPDLLPPRLRAGAVEIDITPPVGGRMAGYAARTQVSQGIHDPLHAEVLYLATAETSLLLVSLDLICVDLSFTQRARAAIQEATGIPPEAILLACSHTHSGPDGFMVDMPVLKSWPDPALQDMLIRKLSGAAAWAQQSAQPARLSRGLTHAEGIGLNRNDPQGGPSDSQVILLRVDDENGQPLAVLFNFGCHPTIMGYDNLLLSADYPGAAKAALRQHYPGTVFLFTNGAAGDVSTRFTRRSQGFREVQRMGYILAGAVLSGMQTCQPLPGEHLSARRIPVTLPLRTFPDPATAEAQLQEQRQILAQLQAADAPSGEIRKAITRVEGAQGQLVMAREFSGTTRFETELQTLQVGQLQMAALPGEPFTRTVLEIKALGEDFPVLVISYANDYKGYFPDAVSVQAGTYEALTSPYDSAAAEILRETARKWILADE